MKHFIIYSPLKNPLLLTNSKSEIPTYTEEIPSFKISETTYVSFTLDRGFTLPGHKLTSLLFCKLKDEDARIFFTAMGKIFLDMPTFDVNVEQTFQEGFSESITFFGGSFNPWHAGHEACVELFPKKEELVLLPDNNPLKEQKNNSLWENYKKMLYVQKSYPGLKIYTGFWADDKKNPTIDWLKNLKQKDPKRQINFLMGSDTFINLNKWKEYEQLLKQLSALYIVSREDDLKKIEEQKEAYLQINNELKIVNLGNHLFESLSSSKLRK